MKKNLQKVFFTFLLIASYQFTSAQTWVDMMQNPDANFYETQQEFEDYWSTRTYEKGKGYKQFRRWEDFMAPRVFPKGDVKQAGRAKMEFEFYKQQHPEYFTNDRAANWTLLGPNGAPTGGGAGRTNFVRFHPTNPNTIYTGAPAGGLWVTTNGGTSWTTNTDQLTVIGCTDIAIDPTNTQIMYLATGDGDAGDTYSIGVLKSTNGGNTWNASGLAWNVTQGRTISKLLINPSNTQIVLAATSNGVYRTTNGGTTWTQVRTGNFKDMEFKPGDPNTVYVSGTTLYRSTDGGASWTQITNGVPTGVGRIALAVTPANANYVYLLAANNTNSGLLGVYRSTNSGTSFTTRATSPNLLGWNSNGGDSGGQGWYDLAIAASETNADVVIVGGVNIWRSTNGGTSWTINGHWTGSGAPYVHADIHDLIFLPGSGTTYYSGNDGGVFRTTNSGGAWTDISANMAIAQQYELGLSTTNANLLVTGHQDNGTNKMNGATWSEIYGGDGMQCFIDRTNNNVIVASYVYGDFKRSTNGGASWTTITTGLPGAGGAWESPIHQDPVTASTYYCGYQNMYRSTNNGGNWSAIGSLPGTGDVVEFDVAPSNTQVIYAIKSNGVYKTTNGGTSWTTITGALPVGSAALTYVEISPTDPNTAWVTFSGYSTGNKVYRTTNGGTSWTNVSTGLPNIPVNCIVYQVGSSDALYLGTDVGVYYIDNTTSTWTPYMTGLPNVVVKDLEIYYATGKIRAATFGRGTWESDLNSPGNNPPVADFTANLTSVCPGSTINFTDLSSYTPTSWSWNFGGGGTPNTSSQQNPSIVFNTPGTYTVTLTATNANGNDAETKTGYITVTTSQSLPLVEGFESATFAPTGWVVNDINANGNTFQRTTSASGFGTSTACMAFDNYSVDEAGGRDEFISPVYDFTGYSSASMTFDVAYARYNATYFDSLYVLVSTDCGLTYSPVYMKGNTTLATAPDVTSGFIPTNTQWRTETINMTPYLGNTSVRVKFQNRGAYGQAMYIDNINITGVPAASLPTADFSGTPTTLCAGQTVAFTNLSVGSPTSYSWSFPGGTPTTSTAANPTVTYNTAGTYSVTLTATNASGSDVETKTNYITVNALPIATATSNSPMCTGNTINLFTPTVSGATYSWSGPGGYTSTAQNPTRPSATLAMAGTYTVTVTANGCSSVSNTIVVVNSTPTATAGSNSPVCSGNTINLTANTVSGATYSWSGPGGYTSTSQNPNRPSSTTAMSGTYTVTITANGCSAVSNTTVVVNATPTATASSNSPICSGQTLNLSTPTVSGATYSWSGPGGYTSTAQNPTRPSATTAMSGTYTVTVTANGCSAVSNTTVVINNAPTATAGSNSPVCTGNPINLTANTVSGATYSWTGPGGFTSTSQNPTRPSATTAMAGTYTLTVNNGCTAVSNTTVVVNTTPTATASSNSPICSGQTLNLSTPTVSGATYSWSGPGGFTSTAQNPTRPSATTAMSGTYTVTVTANGCSAVSNVAVIINQTPSTPVITSNSPVCTGQTLTFTTPAVSGGSYAWSNQGAWTSTSQNPTRPNATTGMAQDYYLTVTANGCTSSQATTTVVVNQTPSTPVITSNSPVCTGQTLTFTTPAVSGGSYAWSNQGAWTSTSQNPTRPNATTGMAQDYYLTVTANGCTSSQATTTVVVNQTPSTPTVSSNSPVCTGNIINLTTSTVSGATYSWTGPGGFTSSSQNPNITSATGANSGTYNLTVTVSGCTSTAGSTTVSVGAPATPSASISQSVGSNPSCEGDLSEFVVAPTNGGLTPSYQWQVNGLNVGTNSSTYSSSSFANGDILTCIMTSSSNCVSPTIVTSNGVTLNINPLPIVIANASSNPICDGESLTLTGSGAATYIWDNSVVDGNGFVPSSTNTYTVIGTDANGCISNDQITVTVNPNPTVSYSEVLDTVCLSKVGTLEPGNPAGGTYFGNGVSGNTFTANQAGLGNHTITYTFTNLDGCSASAQSVIFVEWCKIDIDLGSSTVSVEEELQNDFNVRIVPNPNTGNFSVYLPENFNENASLKIFNAIGQEIFMEQITKGTLQSNISLDNVSRGIYLMTISIESKKSVSKIIID